MDKIKVCHITSAHERYDTRIFHKECKTLVANNYDVSLIVNDLYQDEIIDSINILSTDFKPKNRFQRMIKSQRLIKKRAIEVDADIYHLHDPELLRLASFLKCKSKKVIFDSHEDYVLTIEVKKWIPKPLRAIISKFYNYYENRIISKIDGALVCYHWTKDRYIKINTNTELLFNFPKLSDYIPIDINYGSHNIVYAGGITDQWNHDYVIKSLSY
ncbi:MAG: glycosyltransferase, partial [Acholeplasma sp.]|nr:glycosyltransferase [Acholeplasma sp.]